MIRRARNSDITAVMGIVRDAQAALAELCIDQWQDGYPTHDIIGKDIVDGVGYVVTDASGEVVGYAAIILTGEEAYRQIADSDWHTQGDCVVVHRLCVSRKARRGGVAKKLMNYAAQLATERGIGCFRVDTHRGNTRMLSMLQQLGFNYVGVIRYDSGERIAYDLDLGLVQRA